MHNLIALISSKALLKSTKPMHHWTLQLIRSMKIYGIHRINKTKLLAHFNDTIEIKCLKIVNNWAHVMTDQFCGHPLYALVYQT